MKSVTMQELDTDVFGEVSDGFMSATGNGAEIIGSVQKTLLAVGTFLLFSVAETSLFVAISAGKCVNSVSDGTEFTKLNDIRYTEIALPTMISSVEKKTYITYNQYDVPGLCERQVEVLLHGQNVWRTSGNFWQTIWNDVYKLFGKNDLLIGTFGTFIITFVAFWFWNAFFIFLDTTGKPGFLMKYRIQKDANVPCLVIECRLLTIQYHSPMSLVLFITGSIVDRGALVKVIKQVLFNQTVVGIPFTYVLIISSLQRKDDTFDDELPSFPWLIFEICVFCLVIEFSFYYTHRLFHHPSIYRLIHKRHHEWTAPIGITSLYSHPLEHVFGTLVPVALGPLLLRSHLATMWLWFIIASWSTSISHSGYHFPGLPSPEAHDFHHLKFNQTYGIFGILDYLHGTNNKFRDSLAYKRHFMLFSLVPMSEQFPDQKKTEI